MLNCTDLSPWLSHRPNGCSGRSRRRPLRRCQRHSVTLLAVLTLSPALACAQSDYWNGSNDDWDVATNWSLGLPLAMFDVENDTSGTITHRSGADTVNSFLNTSSGGFNLAGGALTTTTFFQNTGTGTTSISGGTLNVGTDFLNTGSGAVNVSSGVFAVSGNFTNSGTGILTFSGGTTTVTGNFTSADATNVTGGVLSGSGAATSSLEVDNTFLLQSATLQNFTVMNSSALNIQNGTLSNVTLNGGLTVPAYYKAYIGDGVTFGTATPTTLSSNSELYFNGTANSTFNTELIFSGGTLISSTPILTLGSNALVHGSSGTIVANSLINNGVIDADVNNTYLSIAQTPAFTNNGTLTTNNGGNLIVGATNWTNAGTILANDGSTIYLDGNWTLGGSLSTSGSGQIILRGSLTNPGTFDPLSTVGGTHNVILTGTLTGGNLINSSQLQIQNGTLSNVTLNGGLTVPAYYKAYIGDGVTFGTATPTTLSSNSELYFNGAANSTFNTELIFSGGTLISSTPILTLGSNALVHGSSGTIVANSLINNGVIDADVNNTYLSIAQTPAFTNNGTLITNHGGNLSVESAAWNNAGSLIATGSNSSVTSTNAVTNSGSIAVGNGTTMTFNGGLTQTSGSTVADGNLNIGANQSLALQGGLLAGSGTVSGSVTNSGGTVRPGDLLGTLTIAGNYTQTAAGTTEIDLGGTTQGVTYDLLKVNSLAMLAGTLDVKLVNGFTPTKGETFDFLNYGSLSDSYDNIVSLDNGFSYDVTYSDGIGTLTVNTIVSSVPEASTLLSATLMLGIGGLLARRRQTAC